MWAATPFASAASCARCGTNRRPPTPSGRRFCLTISQTISDPSSRLPCQARVSMKASRALYGERRQRCRVEADHKVRDSVAEALYDSVCFGVRLRLAFRILCETGCPQEQCPGAAEKPAAIDRAFALWDHRDWASLSSSTGPRNSSSKFNERNQLVSVHVAQGFSHPPVCCQSIGAWRR